MKHLYKVTILIIIFSTSCTKSYVCSCKDDVTSNEVSRQKMTTKKKWAKRDCEAQTDSYYTRTCKLE